MTTPDYCFVAPSRTAPTPTFKRPPSAHPPINSIFCIISFIFYLHVLFFSFFFFCLLFPLLPLHLNARFTPWSDCDTVWARTTRRGVDAFS